MMGARMARFLPVLVLGMALNLAPAQGQSAQPGTQSQAPADTIRASGRPLADTLAKPSKSRSDSVIVVKHHFNHREQIITGSVIMTCLALMMVAMNNYNPR